MENLGDILKRLSDTKRVPNGSDGGSDNGADAGEDYPVEVEEVCPHCQGRGWLTPDVPVGHPDFGQVVACACQATKSVGERSERLRRYSNLGYLTRLTFDSLAVQGRAARMGFDWDDFQGVVDKIAEEVRELGESDSPDDKEREMGELLFSMVNEARWMGAESENAVRGTNNRFQKGSAKL